MTYVLLVTREVILFLLIKAFLRSGAANVSSTKEVFKEKDNAKKQPSPEVYEVVPT